MVRGNYIVFITINSDKFSCVIIFIFEIITVNIVISVDIQQSVVFTIIPSRLESFPWFDPFSELCLPILMVYIHAGNISMQSHGLYKRRWTLCRKRNRSQNGRKAQNNWCENLFHDILWFLVIICHLTSVPDTMSNVPYLEKNCRKGLNTFSYIFHFAFPNDVGW